MKLYILKTCDSCRKAIQWLRQHGLPYEEIAIREQAPSVAELSLALQAADGEIRRLFNTSGQDYRSLNLKETLPGMKESEALQLLSRNGNLVKRPFLVTDRTAMAGFQEEHWIKQLL